MGKKIVGLFSAVILAAASLWVFSGAMAAPEALSFSVKLDKDSLKLGDGEDTSFNANIVLERTSGSGTNPFQIRVPVPAGTSLNASVEDIKVNSEDVENEKIVLENGIIFWESEMGENSGIELIIPLIVDKCPEGGTTCKINVNAKGFDGKGNDQASSDSLTISSDYQPLKEGDVIYEITSPGDVPGIQRKVTMQYRRTPGTGLNPFIMIFDIPEGSTVLGNPKVDYDNASGFDGKSVGNTFQFEGKVDEEGGVQVSFLLEISGCPGGAADCIIPFKASMADGTGNVVINHEEQYFKPAGDPTGDLDLNIIMIGELKTRNIELELKRDGGEGEQEGELKLLLPTVNAVDPDSIKVQSLKADVGEPTKDGQSIIWPVRLNPDATVKILMETTIDTESCKEEECKDTLTAFYESGDINNLKSEADFTYSASTGTGEGQPNVSLGLLASKPVINPGDVVEVNVFVEEVSAAQTRMPGKYSFLLEVSGLKTTGDINATFTNAGPEKIIFDEKANGLKWEGEIGEGGSVGFKAIFKADSCKNGGSCSADARLTVILPDGTEMIVKDSILIEDNSGFDPDTVNFRAAILAAGSDKPESIEDFNKLPIEGGCLVDCEGILMGIKNNNSDPAEVFITITFPDYLKLGPPDGYKLHKVKDNKETGERTAQLRVVAGVSKVSSFILPAEIDPAALKEISDDERMEIKISTCVQSVGSTNCKVSNGAEEDSEERSPQNLLLLYLIWRARDFGDAPNVNNHFGVLMEAYGPGTALAHYPLGRDPSILNPPPNQVKGPAHRLSNWFHLGAGVTPEFAIDRNWDSDFTNNIEPSIGPNENNFDGADDGIDISTIEFENCDVITIPVDVTITPAIIAFFTDKDADGMAHINMWLDSDRDGRWGNGPGLCAGSTSEHIVIDHTIDPVALGVGTHTVMVPTEVVEWPQGFGLPEEPAWLRVMLTAIESNKDLYITYGDGRGEDFVYFGGETEDYYYVAPSAVSSSSSAFTADMVLDVSLIRPGSTAKGKFLEFPGVTEADGEMVIRFRNDGYKTAENLIIDGDFGPATEIIFGKMTNLKCDGCTQSDPKGLGTGQVSWEIDKLEPGEFGEIILGWTGCLTCVRSVEDVAATATVKVTSKNDFRPLNNVVSLKWPPIHRLVPRVELGWHGCLTCIDRISEAAMVNGFNFIMNAPDPNAEKLRIYQDGEQVGDDFEMCDGVPCEDLGFMWGSDGPSQFTFKTVDGAGNESPASKPIGLGCTNDIIRGSLIIFDQTSGQRSIIPAEAYDDLGNLIIWLANGRKFKAVVGYCGDDPNPELSLTVNGKLHSFNQSETLAGYRLYETSFLLEVPSQRANTSLLMSVESNGTTYEDSFQAGEPMGGHVLDSATGKAISGAKILVLEEQTVEFGDETTTTMVPWESIGIGQENPITTNSDGFYEISVPNGTYQIEVIADGYQNYRSAVLEVTDHMIAGDIKLIEARPAPSNIDVGVNESGFEQTVIQVDKGWVVKFVNTGTGLHGAASAELNESSGLMAPGEGFKMAFDTAGVYEITDPANGNVSMIVQVNGNPTIYLPIILR